MSEYLSDKPKKLIIKDKNVRDSKFSNKQAVKTTKATHSVANQ